MRIRPLDFSQKEGDFVRVLYKVYRRNINSKRKSKF
jgi:hypothetical protein